LNRGRTGAARLQLSVDRCCPKYEEKEEKGEGRKERWEAVEVGEGVIRSLVSCAGV